MIDPQLAEISADVDRGLAGPSLLPIHETALRVYRALAPYCDKVSVVGSMRRGDPHPRDIDILVATEFRNGVLAAMEELSDLPDEVEWVSEDQLVAEVDGVPVDVILVDHKHWGMAMLNYTGPRGFNRLWEGRAKRRGYTVVRGKIGAYTRGRGYTPSRFDPAMEWKTEDEILMELGLTPYRDPRLRNVYTLEGE